MAWSVAVSACADSENSNQQLSYTQNYTFVDEKNTESSFPITFHPPLPPTITQHTPSTSLP